MSNNATEPPVDEADEPLDDLIEDTGNYPFPEDGPQDDVDQAALPQFDEDLVDGSDLARD